MASGSCRKCWHQFLIATVVSYAWLKEKGGGGGQWSVLSCSICSVPSFTHLLHWDLPTFNMNIKQMGELPTLAPAMKGRSIYCLPIAIFLPSTSTKVARWANRHSGTHSPPQGIIIPDTRVAAKSNGALGLPGSWQFLLSYIEMEGMGELWAQFIKKCCQRLYCGITRIGQKSESLGRGEGEQPCV